MEYRHFLINNAKKIIENINNFYCHFDNIRLNKAFFLQDKKNTDLQDNYLKEYQKLANQISPGITVIRQ
tara:strand:+ start:5149 stop:5355 length:207 start_codon:yes stop_codon:yes gene_type:complete